MASFHNWTGDEEIDTQVPQFLNEDNTATQEKLDTKFNKSLDIAEASDLNNFKDEGFYCCNSNSRAETILNCPTNYAFGLMVWGKGEIVYQEVREYNRSSKNQDYNNCWRRSYYSESGQNVWSNWQKMSYAATTLAGYGITDGMDKNTTNSVSVTDILKRNINMSYLRLTGGNTFDKGANIQLCGGTYAANAGQFLLNAADSTQSATLLGSPSGLLKWKNKNIVRSINNIVADENGNVTISVSGGGTGGNITIDSALSSTSTNPVQNKVIEAAIKNKASLDKNNTFSKENWFEKGVSLLAYRDSNSAIKWYQNPVGQPIASIDATNYTGTAARATQDGAGNVITDTYAKKTDVSGMVKSVNNIKPDSNGNVAIAVSGGGGNVIVDTALSATSMNPVQNRVIKVALDDKLGKNDTAAAATKDGAGNTISTTYTSKADVAAFMSTKLGVTATAYAATRDGAGNNIVNTYAKKTDISGFVKTVNGTAPDTNGNVNVSAGGGVSTSVANTWTAQQDFHDLMLYREKYTTYVVNGSDTPTTSTMLYTATGAFTLSLGTLAGALRAGQSSVFTAYFAANADYTLTITNAGTIKYIGSASDVAITSAGLLLNIMMLKDNSGNLTSIVQASKLS